MKKEHMLLVATLGLAFVAIPAFADDRTSGFGVLSPTKIMVSTSTTRVSVPAIQQNRLQKAKRDIESVRKEVRTEISDIREGAHKEVREAREGLRDEAKNLRQGFFASSTAKGTAPMIKRLIEERREEFKDQLEVRREEVKNKIETERLRLNEKLKTLKDERKKQIIQKVNTEIQALNARKLDHYSNVLNQIEEVLKKVGTRVDNASARGLNVATVRTNITAVETAIATARTAIVAQSTKVYTVAITTEENLKNDTGVTRQALREDLSVVQNLVKTAYTALRTTAVSLAQIPRINQSNGSATSTATTTATSTTN